MIKIDPFVKPTMLKTFNHNKNYYILKLTSMNRDIGIYIF